MLAPYMPMRKALASLFNDFRGIDVLRSRVFHTQTHVGEHALGPHYAHHYMWVEARPSLEMQSSPDVPEKYHVMICHSGAPHTLWAQWSYQETEHKITECGYPYYDRERAILFIERYEADQSQPAPLPQTLPAVVNYMYSPA